MYSVFTDDLEHCIITGSMPAAVHHIFPGNPCRKYSEEDGYVIPLRPELHTGHGGIHFNKEFDRHWRRKAQRHYEQTHTREEFIKRYGRSYL